MDSEGSITISPERLKELEAAAAKLKKLQEKQRINQDERLKKLKEYKKEHPEKHKKSSLESYYRNKEAINEKRRAAYKAKKEAEAAALTGLGNPPATVCE